MGFSAVLAGGGFGGGLRLAAGILPGGPRRAAADDPGKQVVGQFGGLVDIEDGVEGWVGIEADDGG
jgi:hypothetical protein